jgi:hypothetical protein
LIWRKSRTRNRPTDKIGRLLRRNQSMPMGARRPRA